MGNCLLFLMTLRDSGITAHEAEIRSKMSLSTLATLGIVSAGKIQILAVQDHTVCISIAQAHITVPLLLFTSPSKAEQVSGFTYLRIFSFSVLHRPNTETLTTHITSCQDIRPYRICACKLSLKLPKALTCNLCVIFLNRNEQGTLVPHSADKIATDSLFSCNWNFLSFALSKRALRLHDYILKHTNFYHSPRSPLFRNP